MTVWRKYRYQDEDTTSPPEHSSPHLPGDARPPELVQVSEKNISQIENVHGYVSHSHISPMKVESLECVFDGPSTLGGEEVPAPAFATLYSQSDTLMQCLSSAVESYAVMWLELQGSKCISFVQPYKVMGAGGGGVSALNSNKLFGGLKQGQAPSPLSHCPILRALHHGITLTQLLGVGGEFGSELRSTLLYRVFCQTLDATLCQD
ncbi:unnamed protein product [Leuciscus chuanchicus]